MRILLLIVLINLSYLQATCQLLENGGMEGRTGMWSTPDAWYPCNEYSTPDTGPHRDNVNNFPSEGSSYLVLATRGLPVPYPIDYEDVETAFLTTLYKGATYNLSIDLAQTQMEQNAFYILSFDNPLIMRIYLNSTSCEKGQLIFESPIIDNYEWRTFSFDFIPESDNNNYLFMEVGFINEDSVYFGNMAMDNLIVEEYLNYPIPNVITPNSDGYNDQFVIDKLPPNAKLEVYDRWGKLVYLSDNYQNDWDGTGLDGALLEAGNYWYVLWPERYAKNVTGKVFIKWGN